MTIKNFILVVCLLTFVASTPAQALFEKRLSLQDIPEAVQRTLNAYKEDGKVDKIVCITKSGNPVYVITLKRRDEQKITLQIEESGHLSSFKYKYQWLVNSVEWRDIPGAARKTIQEHIGDGTVYTVSREVYGGRVLYSTRVTTSDNRTVVVKVFETGKLEYLYTSAKMTRIVQ